MKNIKPQTECKYSFTGKQIENSSNGKPIYEFSFKDIGFEENIPIFFGKTINISENFTETAYENEKSYIKKKFEVKIQSIRNILDRLEKALDNYVDITKDIIET